MVKKLPVASSHLALRFYKNDGWMREMLQPYMISGTLDDTEESCGDAHYIAYFRLKPHSKIDIEKLYRERISFVHRWYDAEPKETDLEYLKEMCW